MNKSVFKDTKETLDLIKRAQAGDTFAENKLVHIYMPYVEYMVSKYSKKTLIKDDDDLRSYIYLGLIEGIRKFDPSKNTRFIYFAHIWMKKQIFLGEHKYRFIRIPINQKIFYDDFKKRNGDADFIEVEFDEDDINVQKYLLIESSDTLSFTEAAKEDERGGLNIGHLFFSKSIENFKDENVKENNNILKENINKILKENFTKKEIFIIEHLFGLNGADVLNASQISKKLGVTKVNVTFTKVRIIKLLRHSSFQAKLLNGI